MGTRANIVIPFGDTYALYYSHYGAESLDRLLFFGPDAALTHITSGWNRVKNDTSGWLDNRWAEGGAVIDVPQKVLLFWGGEDLPFDITERRLYLRLLDYTWPGWTIRWAYDEIFDLAAYVGVERSMVTAESTNLSSDRRAEDIRFLNPATMTQDPMNQLVSVRFSDEEYKIYNFDTFKDGQRYLAESRYLAALGPAIVKQVDKSNGADRLNVELTSGGFHLDLLEKTCCFWTSSGFLDTESFTQAWSGWKHVYWKDEYERHIEATEGHINYRTQAETDVLQHLARNMADEFPNGAMQTMTVEQALKNAGFEVEVNPVALSGNDSPNIEIDKAAVIEWVVNQYKADHHL